MARQYRLAIRVDPAQAIKRLDVTAVAFGRNDWLDQVGEAWLDSIRNRVASRGQGTRVRWAPFAASTIAAGGGSGATLLPGFVKTVERAGGAESRVTVSHPDPKAFWFERGRPPRTIEPKDPVHGARFLVFQTERGVVFTRKVEHPGQPRRPLLPAKRAALAMARRIILESVTTTLAREELGGVQG